MQPVASGMSSTGAGTGLGGNLPATQAGHCHIAIIREAVGTGSSRRVMERAASVKSVTGGDVTNCYARHFGIRVARLYARVYATGAIMKRVLIYKSATGGWMYEVWIATRAIVIGHCRTREA